MKIAVISSTILTCPPRTPDGKIGYGGLEQLAWQQAVGLHNKKHKVTLIAPRGSSVPDGIELHETTLGESEKQAFSGYQHKLKNFDCIIDHSWQKWSIFLKIKGELSVPTLLWLHAPVHTMFETSPPLDKPCFVAISNDQAEATQKHLGKSAKICYNGVDTSFYKPSGKCRNNRYLFLARMSRIKGPEIAINVSKNCQVTLDLVGDDTITGEPDLVNHIKAQCNLDPNLRYIGPQTRTECVYWFNTNKAMLHLNKHFKEPFGLAPIESQACGMPVIAWDNGAMRETVVNKETGFIVNSQEEAEELIKSDAISQIKSESCIENAHRFSYEKMIDRCEALCVEAVDGGGW